LASGERLPLAKRFFLISLSAIGTPYAGESTSASFDGLFMSAFDDFATAVRSAAPRSAVVLGSGLTGVASHFKTTATLSFGDVPGLVPPTVAGHKGQLALGVRNGAAVLVSFGRVHFYEGHSWDRVATLVNLFASWGVRRLILTNAAGGLHPEAKPGTIVILRDAVELLTRNCWKTLEVKLPLFAPALVEALHAAAPKRLVGTYAALTGPCYETPAEIRALAAIGVDAVGMSTTREAAAGSAAGMEVAGLSCITNKAAGLGDGPLSHTEVETSARTSVARLAALIERII